VNKKTVLIDDDEPLSVQIYPRIETMREVSIKVLNRSGTIRALAMCDILFVL